ncbi:1-acyl-sn-glycerol-3-phosphate acyltransferase [Corallococcus exiguus]|uniref:lysophospholipid acyltransferase family protein n=1 Tax=Corallococcus TaxID=83461 RepID=UPI000EDBB3DB|nr:lysophospholipid acyltransferase family protein [Corallococcus sp. AB032C]NNB87365.1 1-acyl-sn-glycerol-3-phosphate acyltransferase [Corallococcus exiguus]NNB98405.1 1-acyl-sn-glycerol-3-phosphate acyltransferase [Corallococcus exiguus]NNC05222.1 1-acyl-sn-glycerol-3-phosphate acyltransferase [Corallococcus exiguus]NPC50997.1 1-acyl-sn-glycerol-3-phosphate acyltransferase [Corallococcus exiguus]RKH83235.1 1-acyl-sn-glycerol-3-phosphate acyltransferase [Corallococcus sp. AB032C]
MLRLLFALMSLLPYGLRRHVVRGLMHGVWGRLSHAKVYGLKDLPDGPCLFICNHLSNADGFTLYRALRPRRVVFLAGVKLHGTVMTRLAAETMDTIDITPNSPDIEALRRCVELLKGGQSVLIFPEGGRSRSGGLLEAKKGVGLIAKRAGVPIVPVALTGTEKLMPINDSDMGGERLFHADVTVTFGPVFRMADLEPEVSGASDARQALVDAMMRRVAALLPPQYQGVYAGGPVPVAPTAPPSAVPPSA